MSNPNGSQSYSEWVDNLNLDQKIDRCKEVCHEMQSRFPELKIVSGYVTLESRPDRLEDHWWLVADQGKIIDPTANQWTVPIVEYVDPNQLDAEPTGRCPVCYRICYDGDTHCSWDKFSINSLPAVPTFSSGTIRDTMP